MLAKIGREPFASDEHLFEIKWDGTRAIALVEGGDYRLLNRKRRPAKERYPELKALAALPPGTVLDGEICVLVDGKPAFSGMLQREQARGERRIKELARQLPATYVVFDLLYRDGAPIVDRPLVERREALREVLERSPDPRIVFSEGVVGDGITFFREAVKRELEGVMAKRLASRYLPGKRSDSWLKIKRRQRVYCAILGFLEEGNDLRSLVIGVEDDGELTFAGKVGSGLDVVTRAELGRALRGALRTEPIIPCSLDALWVEPGFYCAVDFLERTESGELRAPVFVEWMRG
jgi:DNA ligase D-like protein (predicted ligase)